MKSQDYYFTSMNFLKSIRLQEPIKLAAVGAGGKSSVLFQLAREIPGKTILTTTTHISIEQSYAGDFRLQDNDPDLFEKIIAAPDNALIVIIGSEKDHERVNGPSNIVLNQLQSICEENKISIFIEADGSKRKSLKAFGPNEPVIPQWVNTIVHVIGWNVVGKEVNEENIFRVDRYCRLTGQNIGDIITFSAISNLLMHNEGGKKAVRAGQKSIILFNQFKADERISETMEKETYRLLSFHDAVLFGNTQFDFVSADPVFTGYEKIDAVILAAGGSSRMGDDQIKQMLKYKEKSFIRRSCELALNGPFSTVYVVLGCEFELVKQEISGLPVEIIHNTQWENGQSTSVIASINEVMKNKKTGGALFLPVDQPYLDMDTINSLVRCHTRHIGKTIVPQYKERIGAPVLFDCSHFPELLSLTGDKGGRAILNSIPHVYCDISDERALEDIDTMDDYLKLIRNQ